MTRAEMTEIFSVFMLAWPNAETFRASSKEELTAKLGPTITLWAACLRDVDYWTAQKATVKLCQTCKFLPSIAEMREAAEAVNREVSNQAREAFEYATTICTLHGTEKAFAPPGEKFYAGHAFMNTYETFLRGNPTGLPSARKVQKALEN